MKLSAPAFALLVVATFAAALVLVRSAGVWTERARHLPEIRSPAAPIQPAPGGLPM